MRLLQRKAIRSLAAASSLLLLVLHYSPCLAEDENPYLNLTPTEASGVLNRLIANPALIEKLSSERKAQLSSIEVFKKAILDQQLDLLTKRNLSQSTLLKKVVTNLYPPDTEIRGKFDAFASFSERLEYLIATGNISSLIEARKKTNLTAEEKQLLDFSLMGFVRSSTAEKLSAKRSSEALELLVLIPDELWTKEGSGLANQVFSAMIKDSASFSSDQVERFSSRLSSLLDSDPSLKPAVLGIFETSANAASDRGDKVETQKLLDQTRKFINNNLPSNFVEQLLLEHPNGLDPETSAKLIAELKERNELSLKFKLKLMWDGYFGPLVPILAGLTVFFVSISLIMIIFVFVKRKLANLKIENPFKSQKVLPGYMRPIKVESRDNEDEYTRLLSLFNLSDTATENEIKKVYRERMKQLHPDSRNGEIELENSEEFRDLKHAYDRIMDIRSAWFTGRKNK